MAPRLRRSCLTSRDGRLSVVANQDKARSDFYDDCFSQQDMDDAKFRAKFFKPFISYLGTPSGLFYQYNPASGVVIPLH